MGKLLKKISLFLLPLTLTLGSCNSSGNGESEETPIVPPDDSEVVYTYKTPRTYRGTFTSAISYDVVGGVDIDLELLSTYVTLTYSEANEEIQEGDETKFAKFHLNLDLYSSQDTYESSIISDYLLPTIFSDFKYQNIKEYVTDLDFYYLADGVLYTTISKFSGDKMPARGDRNALKSIERELVGTTKLDIGELLGVMDSSESSQGMDVGAIIASISSYLAGLTIDIGSISEFIESSLITILDGGMEVTFKEEGLDAMSSLFTTLSQFLFNYLNLGITLDEDARLINIDSAKFSYNPLQVRFFLEDSLSLKPLLDLNLTRNDEEEIPLEPEIDLEEDYLIQTRAVNAANTLYNLFDDYKFTSSFQTDFYNAIGTINSLNGEQFKRIQNFNDYLGYELLNVDENGIYTSLKEEDEINKLHDKIYNTIQNKVDSDYDFIKNISNFMELMDSKYSTTFKHNLINDIQTNYSEEYEAFITSLKTYLDKFLDSMYQNVTKLLDEYNALETKTLDKTHEFINNLYKEIYSEHTLINSNNLILEDLSKFTESDKISKLSSDFIHEIINLFDFEHELIADSLGNEILNILLAYYDDLAILYNQMDRDELNLMNEYSNYLVVNEDKDNIYDIFITLSNKNAQYYSLMELRQTEAIESLLKKSDKIANQLLDNVITEDEIYHIFSKTKLTSVKNELKTTYNMLINSFDGYIYDTYSANLTYIDKYNRLNQIIDIQSSYFDN